MIPSLMIPSLMIHLKGDLASQLKRSRRSQLRELNEGQVILSQNIEIFLNNGMVLTEKVDVGGIMALWLDLLLDVDTCSIRDGWRT